MVMVGYNPMQVTVGGLPFQVYFDYCVISSRTVSNQTNAEVILDGQMAGREMKRVRGVCVFTCGRRKGAGGVLKACHHHGFPSVQFSLSFDFFFFFFFLVVVPSNACQTLGSPLQLSSVTD